MNPTKLKVKKSHDLVTARHSFSLMEMRLFTIIVSLIDDRDEDFKIYRIPIKNFIDTFELKSKTIYAEISQITTSMLKKVITIPLKENNQDKELKTTLVSSFKYNVNWRGVIEATFHPAMKPYLLQLKSRFLLYDLKNILKISSGNSIRMYELLKSYEGIWKRVFEVEELKQILGVEDKYTKYANFKTRILLKAQEDLTSTDIGFTFEEISENSRRVEKIAFYIHKNTPNQKKVIEMGNTELGNAEEAFSQNWLDQITAFGVSQNVIESEILPNYDELYIKQTLKKCQTHFKTSRVDNPAWFFISALQKGYYKKQINSEQSKKLNKQEQLFDLQNTNQERIKQKEELQKLREEYMNDDLINTVLSEYEWNFLHPIMQKDWKAGKINRFLQGFIDRKLRDLYGMN